MSELPDISQSANKKTEPAVSKITLPVIYNKVVGVEGLLKQFITLIDRIDARVELLLRCAIANAEIVYSVTGHPPDEEKKALTQKIAELTEELKKYSAPIQPSTEVQTHE